MKIHVVVFVDSGLINKVLAFRTLKAAETFRDAILQDKGDCIERLGYTDPAEYDPENSLEITEIDGKHYHVNMDDCLEIHRVEL